MRTFHDPSLTHSVKYIASRLLASIATLGSGAPLGPEALALFIGSVTGSSAQRKLPTRWGSPDPRVLMVAGAAAGIAAVFKTPATGAIFALEVPYANDFGRHLLLPRLIGAATGYLASAAINRTEALFPISGQPPFNFADLGGALMLGLVAGAFARGFVFTYRKVKHFSHSRHVLTRVALAGTAIGGSVLLGQWLTHKPLILGPGLEAIKWSLATNIPVWLLLCVLLLRCLATSAALAGGGVGGVFLPLVVSGALLGKAFTAALHLPNPTLFVVVGVAAVLGAGYSVPLAAVVFVAEATGRPGFIVPGLLATVAADLVMGRTSISDFRLPRS